MGRLAMTAALAATLAMIPAVSLYGGVTVGSTNAVDAHNQVERDDPVVTHVSGSRDGAIGEQRPGFYSVWVGAVVVIGLILITSLVRTGREHEVPANE